MLHQCHAPVMCYCNASLAQQAAGPLIRQVPFIRALYSPALNFSPFPKNKGCIYSMWAGSFPVTPSKGREEVQQEHKSLSMTSRSDCLSGSHLSPQFRSHHWFIDPASPSLSQGRKRFLKETISFVRQVFLKPHNYS